MLEMFTTLWDGLPEWLQTLSLNLALIVAIVLPLMLAVAYFTYAEWLVATDC